MKRTSFLVLFTIFSLFIFNSETIFAYTLPEYYPLAVGNSWTYLRTKQYEDYAPRAEKYVVNIPQQDIIEGVNTWRMLCEDREYYDNYVWQSEGLILMYEYEWDDDEIETTTYTQKPVVLPYEIEVGEEITNSFHGTNYEDGVPEETLEGTIAITLLAVEDVSVPAGTFHDCLKLQVNIVENEIEPGEVERDINSCQWWLAKGVGLVKSVCEETDIEDEGDSHEVSHEKETQELRWATVNGVEYGSPHQWNGIDLTMAEAQFRGATMYLNNVVAGGNRYDNLPFGLNTSDGISFDYIANGGTVSAIPNIDFSKAYIAINGGTLFIYNIDVNGQKLWTKWELQAEPKIAFIFTDYGMM